MNNLQINYDTEKSYLEKIYNNKSQYFVNNTIKYTNHCFQEIYYILNNLPKEIIKIINEYIMNEFELLCMVKKNVLLVKSVNINKKIDIRIGIIFKVSADKRKKSMFAHTFENTRTSKMLKRMLTDEDLKPEEINNKNIADEITLIMNYLYKKTQNYFEKNGMLIEDEENLLF